VAELFLFVSINFNQPVGPTDAEVIWSSSNLGGD
jgi:hypothetical protein